MAPALSNNLDIKLIDLLKTGERFHIRASDNNSGFSFNRRHRKDLKEC